MICAADPLHRLPLPSPSPRCSFFVSALSGSARSFVRSFVLQRTGTSSLFSMLSQHPAVGSMEPDPDQKQTRGFMAQDPQRCATYRWRHCTLLFLSRRCVFVFVRTRALRTPLSLHIYILQFHRSNIFGTHFPSLSQPESHQLKISYQLNVSPRRMTLPWFAPVCSGLMAVTRARRSGQATT